MKKSDQIGTSSNKREEETEERRSTAGRIGSGGKKASEHKNRLVLIIRSKIMKQVMIRMKGRNEDKQ